MGLQVLFAPYLLVFFMFVLFFLLTCNYIHCNFFGRETLTNKVEKTKHNKAKQIFIISTSNCYPDFV